MLATTMNRSPALAAGVVLILALTANGAPAARQAASPQALYTALLTKPYLAAELPSYFSFAKPSRGTPSGQARSFHIVGQVDVGLDGPDSSDSLVFYVFQTAADAEADLAHPALTTTAHTVGKVPGFSLPSVRVADSVTITDAVGQTQTNGITSVYVASGNVVIGAFSTSAYHKDSGNSSAAVSLLRSGLAHLNSVTRAVEHNTHY